MRKTSQRCLQVLWSGGVRGPLQQDAHHSIRVRWRKPHPQNHCCVGCALVQYLQTAAGTNTHAGDILMGSLFDRLQDEIDSRENQEGISPADLLDMPPGLAAVVKQIVRRNGMNLHDVAELLNETPEAAQKTLDDLVKKGYVRKVQVKDQVWYKAHFGRRRSRLSSDIWSALDEAVESEE
jgi:hypothetical protein